MSKEAEKKKQGGLLRSKKKGEGSNCVYYNATMVFRHFSPCCCLFTPGNCMECGMYKVIQELLSRR